ncbi:MAG: DNA-binding response regulator [Betaproteobacteria bacterium]|nr:DNA-binding response regulator [Betaproteobacteria bacterium]
MSARLNILVVEDHDDLRESLVELLQTKGHQVLGLSCAEEVDDTQGAGLLDVLIVDLNLPGEDGFSLSQRFRSVHPLVGIIMVTARHTIADKVRGYDSGADIYLSKPVNPDELLAAVSAVSRKLPTHVTSLASSSEKPPLSLHVMALRLDGVLGSEKLSDADVAMLTALARAPSHRLELWQLLQVLGMRLDDSSKSSMEVRIVRLRKKLIAVGADKNCIINIRHVGYQLCVPIEIY